MSTAELQRSQFDSFFAALDPRRATFPLVVINQLHDVDPARCDMLVEAQGMTTGDPYGTYLCSTGLRDADDIEKAAWPRFLAAAAHYGPR